jgi:hypothetical protein
VFFASSIDVKIEARASVFWTLCFRNYGVARKTSLRAEDLVTLRPERDDGHKGTLPKLAPSGFRSTLTSVLAERFDGLERRATITSRLSLREDMYEHALMNPVLKIFRPVRMCFGQFAKAFLHDLSQVLRPTTGR